MYGEAFAMGNQIRGKPSVVIGGFPTLKMTRAELAQLMVYDCVAARKHRNSGAPSKPKLVFSSNGQGISLAGTDPKFAAAMGEADLVHADGMSVVMASRILTRHPLPERIATTDFFHDAALAAQGAGLSFFLLGGTERQNAAACERVKVMYPNLRIAGHCDGFQSRSDEDVCKEIVESGADVLWVAYGKPKQELWCVHNRERLRGVGWIKTCGGLYAFLAGEVRRAPEWIQRAGLEWLYRTLQDPARLIWRYAVTNPHSIYRMIRYR